MLIGIVGAPNKGKSTIFSALTLNDVEIADYPFTTINPNMGITYATRECVEKELSIKCNARNSLCINGIRKIPVNIVDVAGLVEGAHEGKGMGNQFLNDLASSDALMLVVDASGKTDSNGNQCEACDPIKDVELIKNELAEWVSSIIKKHAQQISKRVDGVDAIAEILAGLKISKEEIKESISSENLSQVKINWNESDMKRFAMATLQISKPMLIVANKSDMKNSEQNILAMKSKFNDNNVVEASAAIELGIRKAEKKGIIVQEGIGFRIIEQNATTEQLKALRYMLDFLKLKGHKHPGNNKQDSFQHA